MAEDNAPAQAPPSKGRLKFILILSLLVALAIGLSVVGTLWFIGADIPGLGNGEKAPETTEEIFVPSGYTVLEKALVTTVQAEGRQRYAQVHLALEAKDLNALEAAKLHMPLLRSRLLGVISGMNFLELQTPEGRRNLADQMLVAANGVLEQEGEPLLQRVLLRNFVVQ
jgi:flagellar FliL protein